MAALASLRIATWRHASFFRAVTLALFCALAFSIRLIPVARKGLFITEQDSLFNLRATRFLANNGFIRFWNWFDDTAWYPLGRPVGQTVHPGLMVVSVLVHRALNFLSVAVSIDAVCALIAPWMAANTVVATYFLAREAFDEGTAMFASGFIAFVPGFLGRSVAGQFSGDSASVFFLVLTFFLWLRSLKSGSAPWAAVAALAYAAVASIWDGHAFVQNIIAVHVSALLFSGRFTQNLHIAYSVFFVIGALLSAQVPFIGARVIKSCEHLFPLAVFLAIQAAAVLHRVRPRVTSQRFASLVRRTVVTSTVLGITAVAAAALTGNLLPWSGRAWALVDPLGIVSRDLIVSSVSEHQPTTWASFWFDFHVLLIFVPVGLWNVASRLTESSAFVVIYAAVSLWFSAIMVRMIPIWCPAACILGGAGAIACLSSLVRLITDADTGKAPTKSGKKAQATGPPFGGRQRGVGRLLVAGFALVLVLFLRHAHWASSEVYSTPSLIVPAQMQDGTKLAFDDYREAYRWIADNTPEDAIIAAWWDYGYEISTLANRTTIVDNNAQNVTQIGMVAKAFISPEAVAASILRKYDVDFVVVRFGGLVGNPADDINKLAWMVRIASAVDPSIKVSDYSLDGKFRTDEFAPTTVFESLLYKLSYFNFGKVVTEKGKPVGFDRARGCEIGSKDIRLEFFSEVFTTPRWLTRIFRLQR